MYARNRLCNEFCKLSEYCTHFVESGQEAFNIGISSHVGDAPNECGREIDEIPYCDFHNSQYTQEELENG